MTTARDRSRPRGAAIVERPEFVREVVTGAYGAVEQPLTRREKLIASGWFRKSLLLLAFALLWQIYAVVLDSPLLFPSFTAMLEALAENLLNGELPARGWFSIKLLLTGYAIGMMLAALLAILAITTRVGSDLLETLTSMLNPLPAIALLPLALVWFGLGDGSVIFVLIHSVLWTVALNTQAGFLAVPQTMRMVGRNYGLTGPRYVAKILIPAAFPSILVGMKIGWAFAWRTLIAAELVFGVSSGSGGLGWFIYENKNQLEIANVFAGLFSVILIGLFVENVIFRNVELRTIRKWGMQQ